MARTRSTATSRTTKPLKSKDAAQPPSIRGEKQVKEAKSAVPVDLPKRSAEAEEPLAPEAIDHRKQFSGTDEHAADRGAI